MNEFLNAALAYAGMGLAVIPLRKGDKRPSTKNGLKDASTDPETIRAWWKSQPGANVGIVCGKVSGNLVVLDFDVDEGKGENGLDTLHDWEREHGSLPETAASITGRGGVHMLYRTAEKVRNSANPVLGVDVRGEGGYIVAPPSVHPTGTRYEWEFEPEDGIAEADANVLAFIDFVRGHRAKVDATVDVNDGGRNNAVYKYACSLRSSCTDGDLLRAKCHVYNYEKCKPPLPAAEVDKAVDSALTKPEGHSQEVKAQAAAKSKKPDALAIYDELRRAYEVCTVDGVPAVCIDGLWRLGFGAVDRAIYGVEPRAGMNMLRDVHHRIVTVAPQRQQADPRFVAFANGVLDMDTYDFFDDRPDLLIPNVIPHDWNPEAECPELDALLARIACNDDGTLLQLHEVLGASMYRSCDYSQMAVLVNNTGANGKSTFIALVCWFVGSENATFIDITELGSRFQAQELSGKLVCLSDDTASTFIDESKIGVLKKAITGNRIHTDVKGSTGYDFTPYALIIASANEMPRIADTSGGFERRLFGIPFDARFDRHAPDYNPRVLDAVMTPAGGSRLAYLAASGLQRVRAENGFTESEKSRAMVAQIVEDNDPAQQFAREEGIDADWLAERGTYDVYEKYRDWSEKSGLKPVSRRTLTKRLCRLTNTRAVQKHISTDCNDTFIYVYRKEE